MTVPLMIVAWAFTIAAVFCGIDVILARGGSRKLFRLFQGIVFLFAAYYYWETITRGGLIPTADLRVVWVSLCIISVGEVISRWTVGGKKK